MLFQCNDRGSKGWTFQRKTFYRLHLQVTQCGDQMSVSAHKSQYHSWLVWLKCGQLLHLVSLGCNTIGQIVSSGSPTTISHIDESNNFFLIHTTNLRQFLARVHSYLSYLAMSWITQPLLNVNMRNISTWKFNFNTNCHETMGKH